MTVESDLVAEINDRMDAVEEQMKAGSEIILKCRQQMMMLKRKLKEYKHLKQQVINHYNSAADGNL